MTQYLHTSSDGVAIAFYEEDEPPFAGVHIIDPPVRGWPVPPFEGAVLMYTDGKFWHRDDRDLEAVRTIKWEEVKQARTDVEFGEFTYNGMVFDGDLDAQRRLSILVSLSKSAIAAGEPFSADFTLADNTEVVLTAQDFINIEIAKAQTVTDAFAKARLLRQRINAATTKEEIVAISWS